MRFPKNRSIFDLRLRRDDIPRVPIKKPRGGMEAAARRKMAWCLPPRLIAPTLAKQDQQEAEAAED